MVFYLTIVLFLTYVFLSLTVMSYHIILNFSVVSDGYIYLSIYIEMVDFRSSVTPFFYQLNQTFEFVLKGYCHFLPLSTMFCPRPHMCVAVISPGSNFASALSGTCLV